MVSNLLQEELKINVCFLFLGKYVALEINVYFLLILSVTVVKTLSAKMHVSLLTAGRRIDCWVFLFCFIQLSGRASRLQQETFISVGTVHVPYMQVASVETREMFRYTFGFENVNFLNRNASIYSSFHPITV